MQLFLAQLKTVNCFILKQKLSSKVVYYSVFHEDSKMGSAISVPFLISKVTEKNHTFHYFLLLLLHYFHLGPQHSKANIFR
jgi:hypothetical protein